MPADLPALAARLREAKSPERVPCGEERLSAMYRCTVLDCEIAEAFGFAPEGYTRREGGTAFDAPPVGNDPRSPGWRNAEPYTTSIDAAAALVRAVAPALEWTVGIDDQNRGWASLDKSPYRDVWRGEAATPALALCLALVEWRIAHGG